MTDWQQSFISRSAPQVKKRTIPTSMFDFTVNAVCKKCNEGWLNNDVEIPVYEVLEALIKGRYFEGVVPPEVATWAAKTALVRACMEPPEHVIPKAHYTWLMRNLLPPPNTFVWLARASTEERVYSRFQKLGLTSPPTEECFYLSTFRLGGLVLFVLGCSQESVEKKLMLKIAEFDLRCSRIWPKVSVSPAIPLLGDQEVVDMSGGDLGLAGSFYTGKSGSKILAEALKRWFNSLFKPQRLD